MKLSKYLKKRGLKYVYIFNDGEIMATYDQPVEVRKFKINGIPGFDLIFDDQAIFHSVTLAKSDVCDLPTGIWMMVK